MREPSATAPAPPHPHLSLPPPSRCLRLTNNRPPGPASCQHSDHNGAPHSHRTITDRRYTHDSHVSRLRTPGHVLFSHVRRNRVHFRRRASAETGMVADEVVTEISNRSLVRFLHQVIGVETCVISPQVCNCRLNSHTAGSYSEQDPQFEAALHIVTSS